MGWIFGDTTLGVISNHIVGWAQSGFCTRNVGSSDDACEDPTFIKNPSAFFANLEDDVGIYFLTELEKASEDVLPGFRASVIDELARQEQRRNNPLSDLEATLSQEDREAFMEDFTEGGWDAFLELTSNPQNYYDGALLSAQFELEAQQREAVEQTLSELEQGDGYLTIRRCTEPGSLDDPNTDPTGCRNYEEVTPGQLIAERVNRGSSTDIERIQNADEITEVVAAVVGEFFFQKLIVDSGLSGSTGVNTEVGEEVYTGNSVYLEGINSIQNKQDEFIQDAEQKADEKLEEFLCRIQMEQGFEAIDQDPDNFDIEGACDVPDS